MTDELAERILRFVAGRDYQPARISVLARQMGIAEESHGRFRAVVKALARSGRLVIGPRAAVMPPTRSGEVVGKYRSNPRGFGFVIPEDPGAHGDLYVPEGGAKDAITGDTVIARVINKGKRGGSFIYEGRITKVVARGRSRFVGNLIREADAWFVQPDGNVLHAPIVVDDVGAKGARAGDQVVVEIVSYPSPESLARGVIVETLGARGDPGVDVKSIIHQHQIPHEFPAECLQQAREVTDAFDLDAALREREDLRAELIITIDPVDARDFDDAISVDRRKGGGWTLGVHIADVAAFVQAGSPLDAQARERGNSVYLPRYVIPMLPEVLSNGLCSLQEGQPRLTKSAFIDFDAHARVTGARFANSVIRSTKRLTYEQASMVLDGKTGGFDKGVVALLQEAERLARTIRQRRVENGMLVLNLPEIELDFDADGRVIDAHPADQSFSHTLIEMFMVEANEAVARQLHRIGAPALRRIHAAPEATSLVSLNRFLDALGHHLPKSPKRSDLQQLINEVADCPESFVVNLSVLRSMQQAVYSPEKVGHFALGSEHYLHFTSPIRRYPDLAVHRLLDEHIRGRKPSRDDGDADQVAALGEHCSFTERRAEDAEKELTQVKVLEMLSTRGDEAYDGVVTGVTTFGVFVQIRRFLIDGLVRFEDLLDDWWEVDSKAGLAVGERTGRRIRVGDPVTVRIARVNVPSRQLDLLIERFAGGRKQHPISKPSARTRPKSRTKAASTGSRKPSKRHPAKGRRRRG